MMYRTKEWKRAGFTLVEVIVVLVILAILAAILIPAMTGWIDKAKEKTAVTECRQVILAAQGVASEAYGSATLGSSSMMSEPYFSQIRTLSQTDGTIGALVIDKAAQVTYGEYTTAKGQFISYDIARNPVYQAVAGQSSNAGVITSAGLRELEALMNAPGWPSGRNKQTQALQAAMRALYNGNPAVASEYTDLLKDKYFSSGTLENLTWRPILDVSGKLLLVASNAAADTANPAGSMIYYNGQVYYHTNYNGEGVSSSTVSDQTFDVSTLVDNPPNPLPKDTWVKII